LPKFVNQKSQAISIMKLTDEHKLLPKLNRQFCMTLLDILKLTIFIMKTIDCINLMLKLLVFLKMFKKNKKVKILFYLIEVHFILHLVGKSMISVASKLANKNTLYIMLKKSENVSYTI
jgi:hypothetical protein